ncbi:MAG: hypothetical protein LBR76_02975, partial [Oscillospiraceae bacterium]|nr:hypothetical protein [Oscillospiraceae bacterium]
AGVVYLGTAEQLHFDPKRRRRELCHSKNLPLRHYRFAAVKRASSLFAAGAFAMPRQRHLFASAPLVRLAANMRFLELLHYQILNFELYFAESKAKNFEFAGRKEL